MKTLQDLFLDELADIYDAEKRILKALPKMARAAESPELEAAIKSHQTETESHLTKVEKVFEIFGRKAKGSTCEATVGLLAEGEQIATEFKGSPAINAAIICALQKVEHYEIATYGCLQEWAGLLGESEAAEILQDILSEEGEANRTLTELARTSSNAEAMEDDDEKDEDESPPAAKRAPAIVTAKKSRPNPAGTKANWVA